MTDVRRPSPPSRPVLVYLAVGAAITFTLGALAFPPGSASLPLSGMVHGAEPAPPAASQPASSQPGPTEPLDWQLETHEGVPWSLATAAAGQRAIVVVFVGTECPIVQQYMPRLKELADRYRAEKVTVVAVDSNRQDSRADLAQFARLHELNFPLLHDVGNRVADQCQATRTPEVVVLDGQRRPVYRGRIDDQFDYGVQRPQVEHQYLTETLDALLADRPVPTASTPAVGCLIGRMREPKPESTVTYANQISRILQAKCVHCHRDGEIGPFAMDDYDEIAGWATMIGEVVEQERMPPWDANPAHGEFSNDPRLSASEKQLIHDWVAAGAPLGNPADLPPPPKFETGWQIGKPDLVVKMAEQPYQVADTGSIPYQYFVVDPGFKEDKWIQAAECRPGNRAVVHHIIVALEEPGSARRGDRSRLQSDWLTATAPGAQPLQLPPGYAKKIPAGSKLIFQMHYTPNGKPHQEDLSEVGLVFADPQTVRKEVATLKAFSDDFRIPPQAGNHEVRAEKNIRRDVMLLAMFPHMHLRGKSFRYVAHFPDGREQILLDVPAYDFNWQNAYVPKDPIRLPAGTKLECIAHFDNSSENPANPDPQATVTWGDQTWEEMMIGYFDATPADPVQP
ncbi:MAG: redoxin domain-containing protein [Pirellulales bacterium]